MLINPYYVYGGSGVILILTTAVIILILKGKIRPMKSHRMFEFINANR